MAAQTKAATKASIEAKAAAKAAARAAAKVLDVAASAAAAAVPANNVDVALTRLEGQIIALGVAVEAHNIASVERDTRIEAQTMETNGKVTAHTRDISILMNDRVIWNWVIRLFIIATPLVAILANLYTAK